MKNGFGVGLLVIALSAGASAAEFPAGDPVIRHGMNVAGVYLQAVAMDPPQKAASAPADIHLEADIHAVEDNAQGFEAGSWVPYLSVHYTLTKKGSDWKDGGVLVPMVANDGPHYGKNILLDGPGKYLLHFRIEPPKLMRHVDKETAVDAWWEAFDYTGSFSFVGTGKKGGY